MMTRSLRCSSWPLLATITSLLSLVANVTAAPATDSAWKDASKPVVVDAVVVGGGYSGAMAAYELNKAGLNTVLLEAKDTLGGKVRSIKPESTDGIIELGATWINNITQPEVTKLTELFGLETLEQPTNGDTIFESYDGTIHRTPEGAESETTDLEDAEAELMLMSLLINASEVINIRDFDNFPEEEDVTVEEWLTEIGLWAQPQAQGLAKRLTSSIVGREPYEVGIHYFLDYIKSGYGLISLVTEGKGGAQSRKIKEGASTIVHALASTLPKPNIYLSSPVTSITYPTSPHSSNLTLIQTANNLTFTTHRVILALPTHMYSNITFTPPLPTNKTVPFELSNPGIYAKVLLTYPSPWWTGAGLVGKFSSFLGPICFSWDTSTPSSEQYSLAIFVAGDIARDWHALPQDEKIPAIREHLARMVPEELRSEARDVQEVNFVEWTREEWIHGAPTSSLGPGVLRKYGDALREDVDARLFFAGTDLAYEWKGYLEGAVTSGKRAAREVLVSFGVEKLGELLEEKEEELRELLAETKEELGDLLEGKEE